MPAKKPDQTIEAYRYTRDDHSIVARRLPDENPDEGWIFEPPVGSGLETYRLTAQTADQRDKMAAQLLLALEKRGDKGHTLEFTKAVDAAIAIGQ